MAFILPGGKSSSVSEEAIKSSSEESLREGQDIYSSISIAGKDKHAAIHRPKKLGNEEGSRGGYVDLPGKRKCRSLLGGLSAGGRGILRDQVGGRWRERVL